MQQRNNPTTTSPLLCPIHSFDVGYRQVLGDSQKSKKMGKQKNETLSRPAILQGDSA
jgi:hypothetical protein